MYLLILRGVKAVTVPMYTTSETQIVPEPLPRIFTTAAAWPTSTGIKCWYCDMNFVGTPRFIPEHVVDTSTDRDDILSGKNLQADVHGCFCDASCVLSYAQVHSPGALKEIIDGILRIELVLTGIKRLCVNPAPAKTDMEAYRGVGGMTIAQWRQRKQTLAEML